MVNSGSGSLKVTLSWNFYSDIDLHAFEPNGTHIYYGNPRSYVTGGFLDVDNRSGGPGAIENIYWENPEEGAYYFYLKFYDGMQSGTCTTSVTYKGRTTTYKVAMTQDSYENFSKLLVTKSRAVKEKEIDDINLRINILLNSNVLKIGSEPIVHFNN